MGVTNDGDCDDKNKFVNPSGIEKPQDGIDQNCDGGDGHLVISVYPAAISVDPGENAEFMIHASFMGGYDEPVFLSTTEDVPDSFEILFDTDELNTELHSTVLTVKIAKDAVAGINYVLPIFASTTTLSRTKEIKILVQKSADNMSKPVKNGNSQENSDDSTIECAPGETCNDGIDNDCNGLTDSHDPECVESLPGNPGDHPGEQDQDSTVPFDNALKNVGGCALLPSDSYSNFFVLWWIAVPWVVILFFLKLTRSNSPQSKPKNRTHLSKKCPMF